MARKVAISTLNASTVDILNVIRTNASYEYQQNVPVVTQANTIPDVGQIIYGNPSFSNEFINALVNRIALVRIKSATFNNPYANLKKGYIEFGESVEDVFVSIAKVVDYNVEKAPSREFKRTLPTVDSVFYAVNWKVMYPITVQREELKLAFLSVDGVINLINKIIEQVYTAAEYDEFLLFKYLLIKSITKGKFYPVAVSDNKSSAIAFRGYSNKLPFMNTDYNEYHVKNNTPKDRQIIFMDAQYNAEFDVDVLASAFNMDRANFMGRLYLIDDFTTFDNERFTVIRENTTGMEEVTEAELTLMANVKAILCDEDWFQVYDTESYMADTPVNAGLYWNYFYHNWKTIAHSPFANAIVFVDDSVDISALANVTVEVMDKSIAEESIVLTLVPQIDGVTMQDTGVKFIQTKACTIDGVGIQPYGAILIPSDKADNSYTLELQINGINYTATSAISSANKVGDTFTFNKA